MPAKKRGGRNMARILFLLAVCGVAVFIVLAVRLYRLQITENSYYESRALQSQLSRTTLTASRGTIYDTNGKILAMSAAVENVFISPYEIDRDGFSISFIADALSDMLDVPREPIITMAAKTSSQYQIVKRYVESDEADAVREFIKANSLTGIYLEPATKRYYPNDNLASQILGFVGLDNMGLDGIERRYDSMLTGVNGRLLRMKNARGTDLLFEEYNDFYAAQDGNNITLTIDSSIQYYIEKHLEQAMIDYDVQKGAVCIAMDPKTGAIRGLASYPNYDPNNFLEVSGREAEKLSGITDEEELANALRAAQLLQWRNKALSDTYEPGSVFKIMTLAMALEENVIAPDELFDCTGAMEVKGREEDDLLHCWNIYGHGKQTLDEALENSCNIALVNMSLKIGAQAFYKYIDAFGLFNKTGLDDEVEGRSLWWDESVFFNRNNQSQLAAASFGQTFKVTPIQMITAAAATINGGYLMQPYMIQQITDSNGKIVEATEPTVLRRVVSSETSESVRRILEEVVNEGTGKNAQVTGYRVGGKTGTSENVEQLTGIDDENAIEKDYIVSFIGFAPADDPEIIILLLLDTPSHETGINISGGAMAAPVVGNMLADILPLSLGIRPHYTQEDLADINIDVPKLAGRSLEDAKELLEGLGFDYRIVGDSDSVTAQYPAPNAYVASGTTIAIYAGGDVPKEMVTVPHLSGMSYSAAKQALEELGLFIRTTGALRSDARAAVSVQSIAADEETAYGSIVEVTLINKDAAERN
ncbi:MAG: penicillin-binding transpeptidase domain-containing protein [Oscillospiraceae bacterium]|nr:penicillin-binding transpeptidase domain-containing protein [Oscillospiraceae bacterium]